MPISAIEAAKQLDVSLEDLKASAKDLGEMNIDNLQDFDIERLKKDLVSRKKPGRKPKAEE